VAFKATDFGTTTIKRSSVAQGTGSINIPGGSMARCRPICRVGEIGVVAGRSFAAGSFRIGDPEVKSSDTQVGLCVTGLADRQVGLGDMTMIG
jgi:hypothetical protein